MKHPNLDKIEDILSKGKDFDLTDEEYYQLTGVHIPKNKWYTENNSAVARIANEHKFEITVVIRKIEFRKNKNEK